MERYRCCFRSCIQHSPPVTLSGDFLQGICCHSIQTLLDCCLGSSRVQKGRWLTLTYFHGHRGQKRMQPEILLSMWELPLSLFTNLRLYLLLNPCMWFFLNSSPWNLSKLHTNFLHYEVVPNHIWTLPVNKKNCKMARNFEICIIFLKPPLESTHYALCCQHYRDSIQTLHKSTLG